MRVKTLGADKPERDFRSCIFAEAVSRGQPVVLRGNGTQDGVAVVLPSSGSAATVFSLLYGVATRDYAANEPGEVQCYGVCEAIALFRQTRSATTADWSSASSIPSYGVFLVDSTVNCFTNAGTQGATGAASTFGTFTSPLPFVVGLQTLAAAASTASATSDTRTRIATYVKAFLRLM